MTNVNASITYQREWQTLDDCKHFARQLANAITEPICIALIGTLGAGKTQFTRFFVEDMAGDISAVSSPTFVLVNLYHARIPIAHLDFYRLENSQELDSIGFDDIVFGGFLCLIEWADKFPQAMPEDTLWLTIQPTAETRLVELKSVPNTIGHAIIQSLKGSGTPS